MNKELKIIDYKKQRDKAIHLAIKYHKKGDSNMAELLMKEAVYLNRLAYMPLKLHTNGANL